MNKSLLLKSTLALALTAPLLAQAESNVATNAAANAGGAGASARLNVSITIPRFISLQVGTIGTNNVDTVSFVLNETQATTGGAVNATSGSPVTVALRSNVGSVDLEASGGNLSDGTNNIPLTDLSVTTTGDLAHPAFGGSLPVAPNVGTAVINRSGTWAYTYNHNTSRAAGTYTATVTYTASAP